MYLNVPVCIHIFIAHNIAVIYMYFFHSPLTSFTSVPLYHFSFIPSPLCLYTILPSFPSLLSPLYNSSFIPSHHFPLCTSVPFFSLTSFLCCFCNPSSSHFSFWPHFFLYSSFYPIHVYKLTFAPFLPPKPSFPFFPPRLFHPTHSTTYRR